MADCPIVKEKTLINTKKMIAFFIMILPDFIDIITIINRGNAIRYYMNDLEETNTTDF